MLGNCHKNPFFLSAAILYFFHFVTKRASLIKPTRQRQPVRGFISSAVCLLNCPRLGGCRLRAGASPASVRLTPGKPSVMSSRGCSFVAERTWIKAPLFVFGVSAVRAWLGRDPCPPPMALYPSPRPRHALMPPPLSTTSTTTTTVYRPTLLVFKATFFSLSAIYKRKAVFVPCIDKYAEMKPGRVVVGGLCSSGSSSTCWSGCCCSFRCCCCHICFELKL